jgi:CRISPR-associated protein Csd2
MTALKNRYDFVYIFDVKDGNPNGDPDAGNLPRIDSETGKGLVTDVCLKRKVRNFVELVKSLEDSFDIYVKEKSILGKGNEKAFSALGIELGQESRKEIPEDLKNDFEGIELPEDISVEEEDDKKFIAIAFDADKKELQKQIKDKDLDLPKDIKKFLLGMLKEVKSRKPTKDESNKGREWMCKNYYDIRTFGAVMSFKSAPNCGQVRGPVQLTFARSVDSIVTSEHTITRVAVTSEKESQEGKETMMGRKSTVPYGLYVARGFVSAPLAKQTGFGEEDLELFWKALVNMFENDRSAARGLMSAQKLYVFKHNDELGSAPANKLFDLINIKKKNTDLPARDFSDYEIIVNKEKLPPQVELIEKI